MLWRRAKRQNQPRISRMHTDKTFLSCIRVHPRRILMFTE